MYRIWLNVDYNLNNVVYGSLNLTGTTYIMLNEQKCVQTRIEHRVCCVDFPSYLIGYCPIFFDDNNICVLNDSYHKQSSPCMYVHLFGYDPEAGIYLQCDKKVCAEKIELYNKCFEYQYNDLTFKYCDSNKVQLNESVSTPGNFQSLIPPILPGNYYSYKFTDGNIYYDKYSLPIISYENLVENKKNYYNIAFPVIFSILWCYSFIHIIYLHCSHDNIKID